MSAASATGAPSAAAPPGPASVPQAVPADAEAFVARRIADLTQPVVLFALDWCEFCWSMRRMFAKQGISYRSVDLDSVEYQAANRSGEIRAALSARTSVSTIPQILVGGESAGGYTRADTARNCATEVAGVREK